MKKSKAKDIEMHARRYCKHANIPYTKTAYRALKKMYMESKDRGNFFKRVMV